MLVFLMFPQYHYSLYVIKPVQVMLRCILLFHTYFQNNLLYFSLTHWITASIYMHSYYSLADVVLRDLFIVLIFITFILFIRWTKYIDAFIYGEKDWDNKKRYISDLKIITLLQKVGAWAACNSNLVSAFSWSLSRSFI